MRDLLTPVLHQVAKLTYRIPRLSFEARLIEYDFARLGVGAAVRSTVLDVGCSGNTFALELAKQGHDVYGLDVGDYPSQSPVAFVKGDITRMPFLDHFFDAVTAISTVEHVGLGRYGDPLIAGGDRQALREIRRVLKPESRLIITVPCGRDTICYSNEGIALCRVYSPSSLLTLLDGFQVEELSYVVKRGRVWAPASASQASSAVERARPDKTGSVAIALAIAYKRKGQARQA